MRVTGDLDTNNLFSYHNGDEDNQQSKEYSMDGAQVIRVRFQNIEFDFE